MTGAVFDFEPSDYDVSRVLATFSRATCAITCETCGEAIKDRYQPPDPLHAVVDHYASALVDSALSDICVPADGRVIVKHPRPGADSRLEYVDHSPLIRIVEIPRCRIVVLAATLGMDLSLRADAVLRAHAALDDVINAGIEYLDEAGRTPNRHDLRKFSALFSAIVDAIAK